MIPLSIFFLLTEGSFCRLSPAEIDLYKAEEREDGLCWLSPEQNMIRHILMAKGMENGVFCLSSLNNSIYMYSHYANSFQGICIGFDSQVFKEHPSFVKIDYQKEPLKFERGTIGRDWPNVFRTKHETFIEENEWRVIDCAGPLTDKSSVSLRPEEIKNSIKEIIFGFNISEENVNRVIEALGENKPKLFVAVPKIGEYKIKLINFNNYEDNIAYYQKIYGMKIKQ